MELLDNIHIANITNILIKNGERIEGNLICDAYPTNYVINNNIRKIRNLQYMSKNKKKIIEIGINACHSLLIMLLENPTAEYLLFDINFHSYTDPCLQYVKSNFPEAKIDVIYGDSTETIADYIIQHAHELNTYDLCHLDGGHTTNIFSHDYNNAKKLLNDNGIVIFDDYDYIEINTFINLKLKNNEIIKYDDDNILDTDKHFIYKYNQAL